MTKFFSFSQSMSDEDKHFSYVESDTKHLNVMQWMESQY